MKIYDTRKRKAIFDKNGEYEADFWRSSKYYYRRNIEPWTKNRANSMRLFCMGKKLLKKKLKLIKKALDIMKKLV